MWASFLVLADLNWTDLDASGGHCAAKQRGSWEARESGDGEEAIVAKVQVDLNVACTLYQW